MKPGSLTSWTYDITSHNIVWTNVTITGATGTWGTQSSGLLDPSSQLFLDEDITIYASAEDSVTGLASPNATDITSISAVSIESSLSFSHSGSYQTPGSYFSSLSGTSAITSGSVSVNGNSFTATQITIVSAVPEPATYALIVGGLTLALVAYRRRRQVNSSH